MARADPADRRAANTYVKVGGLGMKMIGFDFFNNSEPPSSEELAKAWKPNIDTCIAAFGPQRSMFESNFPVDKGTAATRYCGTRSSGWLPPIHPTKRPPFSGAAKKAIAWKFSAPPAADFPPSTRPLADTQATRSSKMPTADWGATYWSIASAECSASAGEGNAPFAARRRDNTASTGDRFGGDLRQWPFGMDGRSRPKADCAALHRLAVSVDGRVIA